MNRLLFCVFIVLWFFGSTVVFAHPRHKKALHRVHNSQKIIPPHLSYGGGSGPSRIVQYAKEYEALRVLHPGVAALLNLWPLSGMGVGSFIQGDTIGGLLSMGSMVGGVMTLMYGISCYDNPIAGVGLVMVLSGMVYSIVRPFRYDARKRNAYIQRRLMQQDSPVAPPPSKRGPGLWSKSNSKDSPTRLPRKASGKSTTSPLKTLVSF